MRIASSSVSLAATHRYERTETRSSSLRLSVGAPAATAGLAPPGVRAGWADGPPGVRAGWRDRVDLSPAATRELAAGRAASGLAGAETCCPIEDGDPSLTANLRVAIAIVEHLTGRRVQLLRTERVGAAADPTAPGATGGAGSGTAAGPAATPWELAIDHHHRIEEHEHTTVVAHARVTFEDGSEREIALELGMSRRFVEEVGFSLRLGGSAEPIDPLVVTLSPEAASFGSDHLRFDLDLDGTTNDVRMTGGTSHYLVHDRDGDGRITDGSELFGPRTGDGFAELAAHDLDGNGWIDLGDPIFHELRLAVSDGEGGVVLRGLEELGVAAIGVASVTSPFSVRDRDGATPVGQIQATGLVLLRDQGVGTVQHVDLHL